AVEVRPKTCHSPRTPSLRPRPRALLNSGRSSHPVEFTSTAGVLLVLLLVLANGFFVAAEFALVTVRTTHIEQLVSAGSRAAVVVQRSQRDPNRFISAAQLGITVASLLLGWIGEETFAALLYPALGYLL